MAEPSPSLRPVASYAVLSCLLVLGHALRARLRFLRVLSLPASCVGGSVGLAAHQLLRLSGAAAFVDEELLAGWAELPSLLTNVVFACLVLGEPLPSPRQLWRLSGPQLAFGQLLAFGQYTAISLATAVWLGPRYQLPPLFAAIVPLGFEGGHGVVAGNRDALERYLFPEGYSLGMAAATLGLLLGTLIGAGLVNWASWRRLLASSRRRQGAVEGEAEEGEAGKPAGSYADFDGCYPCGEAPPPALGTQTTAVASLDSLAHHFSCVSAPGATGAAPPLRHRCATR